MKKITLVLALLLTFGIVAATAQDANISGNATATVGFDLEDGTFGMVNSAGSLSIDLDLIPKQSAETEAADGWYGWVKLKDFEISFDDDDVLTVNAPGIDAKIINGPMYFTIYALDGKSTGQAAAVEDDEDDDYAVEDDETSLGTDLSNGSGGFTFGYTADAFDVALHFATETGYGLDDAENNGHFIIGADAGVMAGPADVTLELVRGIGVEETLGLGLGVDLAVDPIDIGIGFDGQLPDGGDFAWEVGATVDGTFGPATVGVDFIYGDLVDMDLEVDVDLALDPLALGIFFGGYDSFADYRVYVDGSFDATDQIVVSFGAGYDSLEAIPVMVSAAMSLIPNTVFTLKYDTVDVSTDLGAITFATKVSY
jgi:hypothetical protein